MSEPILAKIDVTKLDKSLFFHSEKTGAVYLDVILWPHKAGVSQYGDTHYICQSRPKDDRERDMPIVGNGKPLFKPDQGQPPSRPQQPTGYNAGDVSDQDDIPF